jgi:beta-xylosidase/AraC-like DNA-binding protein
MRQAFTLKLMEIQHLPTHQFDGWKIYFVINGEVSVNIESERYDLISEDIIVVNPLEIHTVSSDKDNLTMIIQINRKQLEEMLKEDFQFRFNCNTTGAYSSIEEKKYKKIKNLLIEMMMKAVNKSSSEFDMYRQFFDLINLLSREFLIKNIFEKPQGQLVEDEKIRRIMEYVNQNYKDQIYLDEVAKKEFLSYSYLSRYFKQEVGVSFSEFITKVRLQNAVENLRYSNDSIIKIAMKNGFSTSKSFYKHFKKHFGVSPADYRMQNQNLLKKEFNPMLESKYREISEEEALHKLSGFLVKNDIEDPYGVVNRNITIDCMQELDDSVDIQKKIKILNIGDADNLLIKDCTDEIEDVQKNLGFKFIRMIGFCKEMITQKNNISLVSDYNRNNRLFNYIIGLGFLPIIVVDQNRLQLINIEDEINELRKIIKHFLGYFGKEKVSKWHFEFSFDIDGDENSTSKLIKFAKELREEFNFNNLLLDFGDIQNEEVYKKNKFLIDKVEELDMKFFFLGLKGDFFQYYNDQGEFVSSDFLDKYYKLKEESQSIFTKQRSIFLTEWNTLVGDSGPLAGTFFRAALIVHTLDILKDEILGFGYWLNIDIKSSLSNKNEDNSLSLFLFGYIKRPAYFTLKFLDKIHGIIIYQSQDTVIYKYNEEYHIIQYNSCLLEPKLSVSNQFIQYQTKTIDMKFFNLPVREYVVKSYLLDKDHGGIYNDWLRLGGEKEIDQEYMDYLEATIAPKYIMKYITIEDDMISLSSTLTMNAVKYICIRPTLY